MTQITEIKKDIYWIGVLDDKLEVFDVMLDTKYGTTYNSYLINSPDGALLIDAVKEKFYDSYIENIKSIVGDLSTIKFLICNHTEPDHSGSIGKLINSIPNLTVIGSRTAIANIKQIVNRKFNHKTSEQVGKLNFGGRSFEFIPSSFLHWPDSMFTYLSEDKIIFTCDAFSTHFCPNRSIKMSELQSNEEESYKDSLKYYYNATFKPFSEYVLKGIERIQEFNFDTVCTGHGPILDIKANEIIEAYKKWSIEAGKEAKTDSLSVVMPYSSAYGYTEEIAKAIKKGITKADPSINVLLYNLSIKNYQDLKPEILDKMATADGVLLGTNTINGDAIPFIWDLALSMNPITHGGKIVSAFGSYGWSGEGVDNIMDRLSQIRCKVIESFKVKFRAGAKDIEDAAEYGFVFGKAISSGEVPPRRAVTHDKINWKLLNPTGQTVQWRCIVCGEIYEGVEPPTCCMACGVDTEMFELYVPERVTFNSIAPEKFVIIGGGAAAVAAAESIRKRNKIATIKILSNESHPPYHRPALSDLLVHDLSDEDFFLHPVQWYTDQFIELLLEHKVTKVDNERKVVEVEGKGETEYTKLIFANGASCNVPQFEGVNLNGVFRIRTNADTLHLKEQTKTCKTAVVIGGGVLGLETVDALAQDGLTVHVIEFMPRFMPRQLDPQASRFLYNAIEKKGVKIHLNSKTKMIHGKDGKVTSVELESGEIIDTDIVVINIGVHANTELAKEAGIVCERCIVVNEKMETNLPGIYACGDVAQMNKCCQSLWSPALAQGHVAGANAAGDKRSFAWEIEPLTMLAFDIDLMAIGCVPESEAGYSVVSDTDEANGVLRRLYFKDDKLVYATFINSTDKAAVAIQGVRLGETRSYVMKQLYH